VSRAVLAAVCVLAAGAVCGCGATTAGYRAGEIYCCGGTDVFVIDADAARADPAGRVWSWRADDSPRIAIPHRAWFAAIDECKPVLGGSAVLVAASSGGGVALIRRADKACLFYAGGRNAHSAELVGDDLLAGTFSFRSDQVRLYRLRGRVHAARPAFVMKLAGAHGVVWDRARKVLWALGSAELLKLKIARQPAPSAEVVKRWKLPAPGGHDLFALDDRHLGVTVGAGVYRFDAAAETFTPLPGLADAAGVKSLCRHPDTGRIIYTQGEPTFTNKVRCLGAADLTLPPANLYKARWNAPNRFSYAAPDR